MEASVEDLVDPLYATCFEWLIFWTHLIKEHYSKWPTKSREISRNLAALQVLVTCLCFSLSWLVGTIACGRQRYNLDGYTIGNWIDSKSHWNRTSYNQFISLFRNTTWFKDDYCSHDEPMFTIFPSKKAYWAPFQYKDRMFRYKVSHHER